MSHYVWQMNDGRWHVSRETNSTQPQLPCEFDSFETKAEATARLQEQRKDAHLVVSTGTDGAPLYYTGRAGCEWLSPLRREAFAYLTGEGAQCKVASFNRYHAPTVFTARPL